eukprot:15480721-Alexandrium_andersonii.AAC.1
MSGVARVVRAELHRRAGLRGPSPRQHRAPRPSKASAGLKRCKPLIAAAGSCEQLYAAVSI